MDEAFREELTDRRIALGLTQAAAGAKCTPAIKQQTISDMESGAADTRIGTLTRYCRDALGCRLVLVDV